jgi:hypothetical protein
MVNSFFSDAGWIFFATWSLILVAVGVAAFGRDAAPREHDSGRNLRAAHKR